jgi:hypothetical protein
MAAISSTGKHASVGILILVIARKGVLILTLFKGNDVHFHNCLVNISRKK